MRRARSAAVRGGGAGGGSGPIPTAQSVRRGDRGEGGAGGLDLVDEVPAAHRAAKERHDSADRRHHARRANLCRLRQNQDDRAAFLWRALAYPSLGVPAIAAWALSFLSVRDLYHLKENKSVDSREKDMDVLNRNTEIDIKLNPPL